MNVMLAAPDPTAAATRRIEPWRTSPAAKIPGTLVSSMYWSRFSGQPGGGLPSVTRSGPVRTKPASLSWTTPRRKPVWGTAPMRMNRPATGRVWRVPSSRAITMPVRWSSPSASTTWDPVSTSMFGVARIWSTRYVDILASRVGARTTIVTWAAVRESMRAAWPAEFAPPITATSSPLKEFASDGVAP